MEAITSLRLRRTSPACARRWPERSPISQRVFPPRVPSSTHAWTDEMNRGRHEQRVLTSRPYSSEQACFPCVEQIAKGFRKTSETKGERVYSITSRDPQNLDAAHWLSALRTYWGIESGLHQRLDASANEDTLPRQECECYLGAGNVPAAYRQHLCRMAFQIEKTYASISAQLPRRTVSP